MRKSTDDKSVIEMQRLEDSSNSNRYKVIIGNTEIKVDSSKLNKIFSVSIDDVYF